MLHVCTDYSDLKSQILQLLYMVNISPSLPQRDLRHLTRVSVHWGRRNQQTFCKLQDLSSELIHTSGGPKYHCAPRVRAGACAGQEINTVLARFSQWSQCVLEPTQWWVPCSGMQNGNRLTQPLAESLRLCLISSWMLHQEDSNSVKRVC